MTHSPEALSPGHLSGAARARDLNADCRCVSVSPERLHAELEAVSPGFHAEVMTGRPHLFSESSVFVADEDLLRMHEVIAAIERVISLPAYREHVMRWAPVSAALTPRGSDGGVFLGYDFHLGAHGPQLIEINTNAGGGLLNALIARAQRACCPDVTAVLPGGLGRQTPEELFLAMFAREWQLASGVSQPTGEKSTLAGRRIAIVDDEPERQFLYPEFVLFQRLFESAGMQAVICDPRELAVQDGALCHGDQPVDIVYNRLTDFALDEPRHTALREAWEQGRALITPHPRGHALYADKRNLTVLTDPERLAAWGVDPATCRLLADGIPRTELVLSQDGDALWHRRRSLFFKPAAGYGSKAAYRGEKLTTRVFAEILEGTYVAQAFVPPSTRNLSVDGEVMEFKLDLRHYVYDRQVQLIAARLWRGQTTNFRTPGGGMASVLAVASRPRDAA